MGGGGGGGFKLSPVFFGGAGGGAEGAHFFERSIQGKEILTFLMLLPTNFYKTKVHRICECEHFS